MELRIEPHLKYCPHCRDEYRAEIATCASCQRTLLTGREMQDLVRQIFPNGTRRSMAIKADDDLTTILQGPLLQLKQVQALLSRHKIPSLLVNEDGTDCNKGCCGPTVVLQVKADDLEAAVHILQQEHVRSTGLAGHDHSHVGAVYDIRAEEATCPACGFVFPTSESACPDCGLQFA